MQELTSIDSIELLLQINVTSAVHGDGSKDVSPQSLQDNVIIEEHPVRLRLVRFGLPKHNKVDKLESPVQFSVPVISHPLQSRLTSAEQPVIFKLVNEEQLEQFIVVNIGQFPTVKLVIAVTERFKSDKVVKSTVAKNVG